MIQKERKLHQEDGENKVTLSQADFNWLMQQSEALCKIADEWICLEEQGTVEEMNDFYSYVQDVLNGEEEDAY